MTVAKLKRSRTPEQQVVRNVGNKCGTVELVFTRGPIIASADRDRASDVSPEKRISATREANVLLVNCASNRHWAFADCP